MKKDIHPKYFIDAKVKCACGNAFSVGSTKEFIDVEVCPKCHPFYTGKDKILDTMGRVQKFQKKMAQKHEGFVKKKDKRAAAKSKKKADK